MNLPPVPDLSIAVKMSTDQGFVEVGCVLSQQFFDRAALVIDGVYSEQLVDWVEVFDKFSGKMVEGFGFKRVMRLGSGTHHLQVCAEKNSFDSQKLLSVEEL